MMRIKVIFLFLFLYGCKHQIENKTIDIDIIERIKIKPESLLSTNPAQVRLIESDSGKSIFVLSNVSKNFQLFNLDNGNLIKEINLEYEGPNSVRNFTGVGALEKDTVWLTFSPHAIGSVNFEGELIFKKNIEFDLINITVVYSDFHQSLYHYEDKIFGMQPLFMGHHTMTKRDIKKHPLVYSYNRKTGDVKWYDVFYADDYWDQGKKLSNFSWARREDKLYISPWYDHEIQVFDMQSEVVEKKVPARSSFIDDFYYVNEIPGTNEEGLRNRLNHDLYGIILYDKYRDVFYRFFYPGYKDDQAYTMEELWKLDRSRPFTGIMVLDRDLNVVGEHVFEKFQVHSSSNMFVGENGLYLSLNNENLPDYDEDHLKYMVVRFNIRD